MKLNGDWFYDQFKYALKTLGLSWGDKGHLTIGFDDRSGLVTFQADRRMLQIPTDEDIRNEVCKKPHLNIDAAARKLAECMDYPWVEMPEKGKAAMREHARAVIEAANKD